MLAIDDGRCAFSQHRAYDEILTSLFGQLRRDKREQTQGDITDPSLTEHGTNTDSTAFSLYSSDSICESC